MLLLAELASYPISVAPTTTPVTLEIKSDGSDVIAVLGNSITAGAGLSQSWYKAVSGSVTQFINAHTATPPTYVTSGVSGNTVTDLLNRCVADIVNHVPQPTVVIVEAGVNDIFLGVGQLVTFLAAQKLIQALKAIPNVRIMWINACSTTEVTPPDAGNVNAFNAYNHEIYIACLNAGICHVDIRAAFLAYELANNPTPASDRGFITIDGIHPNDAGQTWWCSVVNQRFVFA